MDMAQQISSIFKRIVLVFLVTGIAAILITLLLLPVLSDATPRAARHEFFNLGVYSPIFLLGGVLGLYLFLRPIISLGRVLDVGSTPARELVDAARRVAFTAPLYLFVFPTVGAVLLSLLADVLGVLFLPGYVFIEHFPGSVFLMVLAACASLIVSTVAQHWMRPVLLYAASQSLEGRRFNIRARLFSTILILTLIAVLFGGLVSYSQASMAYRQQLADQALIYLGRAVYSLPIEMTQSQVLDYIAGHLGQSVEYDTLVLVTTTGEIVAQRQVGATALTFEAGSWAAEPKDRVRQDQASFVLVPVPVHPQWVGIGYQVNPLHSKLVVNTLLTVSIFGAGMVVLVAVISYYLAVGVALDLRFVTGRLLDIAHKEHVDLTTPVPILSLDEVGDLIVAYNALQEKLHAQQAQIEREQGRLMALQSLSYKIGRVRDVDRLLRDVVQDVERAFGYRNVFILLVAESRQALVVAAADPRRSDWIDRWVALDGGSIAARVVETGAPLLTDDTQTKEWRPLDAQARSEMAVPLLTGERVIGVLDISSEVEGAFDDNDLRVVTALGNQVSIAIENSRLVHDAVTDAQELERRAQNQMAVRNISMALSTSLHIDDALSIATEKLVSLFGVGHSTVFFFEAQDAYGEIAAEYPSQGLLGQTVPVKGFLALQRIVLGRAPLFIADVQHSELMAPIQEPLVALDIRSMLLLPLQSKGIIVGVLTLDAIGQPRAFTPQEIDVCQTVAAQVAVAIENARLFESMRLQADMLTRVTRDVTAERGKLDAVLKNLVDGLLVTDTAGRVILVNPSFVTLFDLEQRDFAGEYIASLVPQLALQHLVVQTCFDQTVHLQEFELEDGRILQCTAAVVFEEGQVSGVVLVLRDITQEKRLERLKSDFISTVSHELRTPLTIVSGFARRISKSFQKHILPALPADRDRAGQRVLQNIENLLNGVDRLDNLVQDVLIIADMDSGRFQWHVQSLDVGAICRAVVEAYREQAEAKGLRIETEIPPDLPSIEGDGERLSLVLENLVTNAIKFTDAGQVSVHVQIIQRRHGRWAPPPLVDVPDRLLQNAYILVVVSDTGVGLSANAQRGLFERFGQGMRDLLTDKPAGTGLGLSISREIVAHHGGHIWVQSEPEQGSQFAFVIPLVASNPQAASGERTRAPTILVVDDEEPLRNLLRYIFSENGYQTIMAADGQAALNMARMYKPDLILLDIMMPGISGLDVTSVLKNDHQVSGIPIVILSVVADPKEAAQFGADACLSKPIDQDLLLTTVADLLHRTR